MSAAVDRVKILVLGASGVGKSSLVHLISHGKPLRHISYTVGAAVEVKLHEYREGTPSQKTFCVELWDVGGSHSHRNSRHVFYHNYHGIILVHDLANRKSQQHLEVWLREVTESEFGCGKQRDVQLRWEDEPDGGAAADRSSLEVDTPLLVIGTKQDLSDDRGSLPVRQQRKSFVAEEYGTEEIHLNCTDGQSLLPGSSSSNKLARFFDKVVGRQFYRRENSGGAGNRSGVWEREGSERRRLV